MINRCFLPILLSLAFHNAAASEAANAVESGTTRANLVIVLSWDGMRHDYPDLGNFPGLARMESGGARATRLTPVYPSGTFPGHVALATGAPPSVSGILDNTFLDRKQGRYAYSGDANWIHAEPLWIAAERQGIRAAAYFWVGSETDWHGLGISYRIAPFDAYRDTAEKVDQILAWIDLPQKQRPGLIMSYWSGVDSIAHLKGPDHPDVAAAIVEQDSHLQRLIVALDQRSLWQTTTLILVSDHGMTTVTESVEVETALEESGIAIDVIGGNAVKHLFLRHQADTAAVLKLLRSQPHIDVFDGDAIPPELRFPGRTGDIVVTTGPPYTLSRDDSLLARSIKLLSPLLGWQAGAHGYRPGLPDMGGIFMAMGRGVGQGISLGAISQLQLAPTVAALLAINPPADATAPPISLDHALEAGRQK